MPDILPVSMQDILHCWQSELREQVIGSGIFSEQRSVFESLLICMIWHGLFHKGMLSFLFCGYTAAGRIRLAIYKDWSYFIDSSV